MHDVRLGPDIGFGDFRRNLHSSENIQVTDPNLVGIAEGVVQNEIEQRIVQQYC